MTTQNLRLKITSPSIKLKSLPRYGATLLGNTGVSITSVNGVLTAKLALLQFGIALSFDQSAEYVPLVDAFGNYQLVSVGTLLNPQETVITSANSPYAALTTDAFLMVDTTGGPVEIDLTIAAARNGASLSIKDYKGNAAVNNITIKPSGAETIDGFTNAAPLKINANYDGVKLRPSAGKYVIAP